MNLGLISVNPRELSAYLRMECNFFTCIVELVLPPLGGGGNGLKMSLKLAKAHVKNQLALTSNTPGCSVAIFWARAQLLPPTLSSTASTSLLHVGFPNLFTYIGNWKMEGDGEQQHTYGVL